VTVRAGEQVGPYRIEALIGAGGMGEVYRAHDTRLGRFVAIKVIASARAGDVDRVQRFEQEARAAGQLNHPNIVSVHDVGIHQGTPYLVIELLQGETLRQRLDNGPLPLRNALEYARQMAAGLAAAHQKHVVHRDLKPENLFLTRDGLLKILDFGLAKLKSDDDARDERTRPATTESGTVLGTVGYMSPEQVRGGRADERSDIFSFGAILYEMITGGRAFQEASSVETMNAILSNEPPPLPPRVSTPALNALLQLCLEKQPEQRFQSAHDLALGLQVIAAVGSSAASGDDVPAPSAARRSRRRAIGLLTVAVIGATALLSGYALGRHSFAPDMRAASAAESSFQRLTFRRGPVQSARFSPDGQTILYSAAWDGQPLELFMTRVDSPESRPLGLPWRIAAVSSRGELAILNDARLGHPVLARVPLGGGAPRAVLDGVGAADWCADGQLAVLRWGDEVASIEFPIGNVVHRTRSWRNVLRISPDGDHLAFMELDSLISPVASIVVLDRRGNRHAVATTTIGNESLAWAPHGDEIWYTSQDNGAGSTSLYAATLTGQRRLVARLDGFVILHDISRDGHLLFARVVPRTSVIGLPPGQTDERDLSWFSESHAAALSGDGRSLVITETAHSVPAVYLRAMDGSPAIRLGEGWAGNFSPDDKWVIVTRNETPQVQLLPTGAGVPRAVPTGPVNDVKSAYWFPDGRRILLNGAEPGRRIRYYALDAAGHTPPRAITPEGVNDFPIHSSPISPDGRWLIAWDLRRSAAVLFPIEGGSIRPIPHAPPDSAIGWADNNSLYVSEGGLPLRVFREELATGRRVLWRELMPSDPAGVGGIENVHISAKGTAYAYTYGRVLSDLYVASGIR
jgi:eukaryotic-like serine/threonine-protein kinase